MKPRILIAEDNPETRELLAAMLVKDGSYSAEFAATGQEALDLYAKAKNEGAPYELLILDNAMPNKTGVTVAEEIRAAGDTGTRILFFTALHPDEIETDAETLNAGVIYKPDATLKLVRHIHETMLRRIPDADDLST